MQLSYLFIYSKVQLSYLFIYSKVQLSYLSKVCITKKYTLHDEQGLSFMGEVKQLKKIIINRLKPSI